MKVLTSEKAIQNAEERFETIVRSRGQETGTVTIGYQSGQYETRVFWLEDLKYWAFFGSPPNEKSPGDRYWNAFGLEKPSGLLSIACEINPPVRDINRQAAGVFLEDAADNIHVAHRGIVNARGRVKRNFVFSNFRGEKRTVDVADQ